MRTNKLTTIIAIIAAGTLVLACGGLEGDSVEVIEESLELENGGFDMEQELPRFGLPGLDDQDVDVSQLGQIPEEPGLETFTGLMPPKAPYPCPKGLLKGEWKPLVPGKPVGVFRGKWVTANGKVEGHLRGIYGKNLMGHGVFFGKYIDKSGTFRGLLKGHYGNGFFKGRWHGKLGADGELHGVYAKGTLKGAWKKYCASCNNICKPGYTRVPGKCFCVPAKVVPCMKGQCPQGMLCDPCPKPAACSKPGVKCPAVCAPPVCVKKPAKPSTGTQDVK